MRSDQACLRSSGIGNTIRISGVPTLSACFNAQPAAVRYSDTLRAPFWSRLFSRFNPPHGTDRLDMELPASVFSSRLWPPPPYHQFIS